MLPTDRSITEWVERLAKAIEYHGDCQIQAATIQTGAQLDAQKLVGEHFKRMMNELKGIEEDDAPGA